MKVEKTFIAHSIDSFIDVVSESYDGGIIWEPVFRAKHTRKASQGSAPEQV